MKTLSLKLPSSLDARLTAVAKRRKTSKSALAREALESYLADKKGPRPGSFADVNRDLIGSVDSGIRDLAAR